MGKGKSTEVQRKIGKSKSKVGVSGRELDTMKLEIHPSSRVCISFSHESASCYRTINAWHLQVISLNRSGMLTILFFGFCFLI